MNKNKNTPMANPFVAIMYSDDKDYQNAIANCIDKFGDILGETRPYNFSDITNYYEDEFGKSLLKKLIVFKKPVELQEAHRMKLWSNKMEDKMSNGKNRIVNIDPGYLSLSKFVLFSTKNYSHRIYLNDGIFAEITLLYESGGFEPQSWTYPDYAKSETLNFLEKMRKEVKFLANKNDYTKRLV